MELYQYVEVDDMMNQAINVERQLKRKSLGRRSKTTFYFQIWKDKTKKRGVSSSKKAIVENKSKGITLSSKVSTNKSVKCLKFQNQWHIVSKYPTKIIMLMEENK